MKIRSLIGMTCVALGLASPSFASYYDVDFSLKGSTAPYHVTGAFTFLSIADGEQPLFALSVDAYGWDWDYVSGTFTFHNGQVTSASFSADLPYGMSYYFFSGDNNTARFTIWELHEPWGDSDWLVGGEVRGPIHFDVPIAPVPLPASLPLLLVGLAGFVGLRHKRKQTAQV